MTRRSWKKSVRNALRPPGRVVVLGVGNPDKGDDGAGISAAQTFARRLSPARKRRVRVLLGGSVPENLTGKIRAFRPGFVLILDAALGGLKPGSVFIIDAEKITDDGVTTHQISLRWVVRYIEESIGCPVLVLGIQPETIEFKENLSPAVEKGISNVVEFLLESLSIPGRRPGPG